MRRLAIGILVVILFSIGVYYGFFSVSSPTILAVADVPVIAAPLAQVQEPIVVSEEVIEQNSVLEQISQNSLAMNSLWIYNAEDGSIVDMLQVGVSPVSVQISPNGWWAYVLNAGSNSISVIDIKGTSIVQTIALNQDVRSMRLSKYGDLLAVVTYSNKVLLFETKEFNQVASLSVGKKPADVVFASEGKYLFVVTERSNMLEKINPYLGHAIGLAEVGKAPVAVEITSKDRAFVVNSASGSVSVIDVVDMSRDKKYDIPVGAKPVDILIDPKESFAFVANKDGNSVSVFDVESFKPIAEIPVGKSPVSLAYNYQFSDGVIYSANEGSNDISVINAATKQESTRWKAGVKPSSISVSPDGKFIFVTMKGKTVLQVSS